MRNRGITDKTDPILQDGIRRAPGLLEKTCKPLKKGWIPESLAFQKKVASTPFLRGFMLPYMVYMKDVLSIRCLLRILDDGTPTADHDETCVSLCSKEICVTKHRHITLGTSKISG